MARQAEATAAGTYLTVPGGRLYYEVSGSGPVLLLIPGGMADSGGFLPLAGFLEDTYTVVRYDPRGISNSRFEGEARDVSAEEHGNDAGSCCKKSAEHRPTSWAQRRCRDQSGARRAASTAGAERWWRHEPPLVALLPEGDPRREAGTQIYETYLNEGPGAAMAQFLDVAGMDETAPPDMSPEAQEFLDQEMARMEQNLDFFFAHYLLPLTSFVPDIARLQGVSTRLLVGVGEDSVGQETYDTSMALAERLGRGGDLPR